MGLLESYEETQVVERLDIPYQDYISWQATQIELRKNGEVPDTVSVMTFANSVYTAPDNGTPVRVDLEEVILKAKRGGEETWHGPGQIIVAPVVRLSEDFNIRAFTDLLEDPIRKVLREYGVDADPRDQSDFPGVQVEERKIAQLGLHLDDRVTSYGIAFNVTCDLSKFDAIDLCGIENCAVTNLESEAKKPVVLSEVFSLVSSRVKQAFLKEDWLA